MDWAGIEVKIRYLSMLHTRDRAHSDPFLKLLPVTSIGEHPDFAAVDQELSVPSGARKAFSHNRSVHGRSLGGGRFISPNDASTLEMRS